MTTIKCPVCLEELEIEDIPEEETHGCALCGKRVTAFTCPYCLSEFTPPNRATHRVAPTHVSPLPLRVYSA